MKICHFDWFNKQADSSGTEEKKLRRESQTKNDRKGKGKSRGCQPDVQGAGDEHAVLIKVLPCGRA